MSDQKSLDARLIGAVKNGDHREPQFLATDVESGRVVMFEHESNRFLAVADSLAAFLALAEAASIS